VRFTLNPSAVGGINPASRFFSIGGTLVERRPGELLFGGSDDPGPQWLVVNSQG
jgi:hypothetical protein